jgi:hypothetical protein
MFKPDFPKLIGIHGHAGTGKDTIAKFLHSTRDNTWALAFADPLKEACATMFGLPINRFYQADVKELPDSLWDVSPREILQYVGTEIIRHFDLDFWVNRMHLELTNQTADARNYNSDDIVVITDVRFQNEYDYVVQNSGIVIHLTRPGYDGKVGIPGHQSEAGIQFTKPEVTWSISNDSTLDNLYGKVDECVNHFGIYKSTPNVFDPANF